MCFLSHYFLTRVDGWSNDSNQFVCSCLLLIPNVFRSFHAMWLRLLLLLPLFCFNFRAFWIASNSSCQRVNRSRRHKKRFDWMHHNKILIGYQRRLELRCFNATCLLFQLLLLGCCCQKGEGSQMMMNALLFVHDIIPLGMGRMRKTHKICLRAFDWRFPMEKSGARLVRSPVRFGSQTNNHKRTQTHISMR